MDRKSKRNHSNEESHLTDRDIERLSELIIDLYKKLKNDENTDPKALVINKLGRKFKGLHLIDRQTFMNEVSSRGRVERLVTQRKLTPYYENGQPKKPIGGIYDRKPCFYDFNEYLAIDFRDT